MAKYLDYNGVKYFWQKVLARFSKKGHTHTVTIPAGTSTTVVTSVTNSVPPTLGTAFSIPNVTAVGTAASASVTGHKATFTNGTAPTLGTAFSVPNVTAAGSASSYSTGTVYSAGSSSSTATSSADVDPT